MKWFKSISLILLLLLSNSSIAANYHWCAGELMNSSISFGAKELSCGMMEMDSCAEKPVPSDQESFSSRSCCDHASNVLSLEDELLQSDVNFSTLTSHFLFAFVSTWTSHISKEQQSMDDAFHHPLPSRLPIYIIHCSYLI